MHLVLHEIVGELENLFTARPNLRQHKVERCKRTLGFPFFISFLVSSSANSSSLIDTESSRIVQRSGPVWEMRRGPSKQFGSEFQRRNESETTDSLDERNRFLRYFRSLEYHLACHWETRAYLYFC